MFETVVGSAATTVRIRRGVESRKAHTLNCCRGFGPSPDALENEVTIRKPVSKKLRFDVFKRDQFVCQYCGSHPPAAVLHVDHIHPVAEGGDNSVDNLITACESCNLGKGARLLSSAPKSLEEKAMLVAEREEQIRGYNNILKARAVRIDEEAWEVAATIEQKEYIEEYSRSKLASIRKFLAELPQIEVLHAAEIASLRFPRGGDRGFKYFCGVCWSKIREERNG
jgi:hypothetical protein